MRLTHKQRRAIAPELGLDIPTPAFLVPQPSAVPMHFKADGAELQADKGDRRSE